MTKEIGKKVKELRTKNKLTLKDLSQRSNLSIGFLSQLERGLTTIAVDSLAMIAECLGTNLSYFIEEVKNNEDMIVKSYDRQILYIENENHISYKLSNNVENKDILPRLVEILPCLNEEKAVSYSHDGQEFIYVLEGILTLQINNERYDMYPGDSAHFDSQKGHIWSNNTNKTVKLLTVHTPNVLKKEHSQSNYNNK